jgi:hypothetical protein
MTVHLGGFNSAFQYEYTTLNKNKPNENFFANLMDDRSSFLDLTNRGRVLAYFGSFRGPYLESIDIHRELK